MTAVVALLSQKGGVGKSTLARTLAVVATEVGLDVAVADLDPQQRTLMRWVQARDEGGVVPAIHVKGYDTPKEALAASQDADLLILDMPGRLSDAITGVSRHIHFILQPTSPSIDDLHPSILVFQALQRVQYPRERMAFALCRALGDKEAEATRDYLEAQGHAVLRGAILERLAYRNALNLGRSLTETKQPPLNAAARVMMLDLLDRALTVATASHEPEHARRQRA